MKGEGLVGEVGLGEPLGVDGEVEGGGLDGGAVEEVTGEPGDLIGGEGDIEGALGDLDARSVERHRGEVDGALLALVGEGVEVELLLARGDIIGHGLGAFHTAEAGGGIEGSAAAGVFELHLGNALWIVIADDEAAEGDDAVKGDGEVDGFGGDGDVLAVEEGVAIAIAVVELYLSGGCHGGVALAAMGHDDKLEGAGIELEGDMSEIGHVRGLVDLLEAFVAVIDGVVEVGAGFGGGCAGVVGERGLLQLEDGDGEVARGGGGAGGDFVTEIGLLAGGEEERGKEEEEGPEGADKRFKGHGLRLRGEGWPPLNLPEGRLGEGGWG